MITVLIVGFFMSIFLIVLLLGKKNKLVADKILIAILAVYALTIGGPYIEIYNLKNNYPFPHLMNNAWLFLLLHGPLLWLYIKSLIIKDFKIRAIHLLHIAPFAAFLILHYFNFLSLTSSEKILLTRDELFSNTLFFKVRGAAIGISSIGYNIWALILLSKHRRNIKNQFSNLESIDLRWLKTLITASLIVFSINVFLFNINNFLHFAGYYQLALVAYNFSAIYVLFIGYFGIKQPNTFFNYPTTDVLARQSPPLSEYNIHDEISEKLVKLMEFEQPYLDPKLNLDKLSNLLQAKPQVLSDILNSKLNQNFFDFINKHRIEEFKIQCLQNDKKHLSIIGIAYECGFNSKASFYRAFKKYEGLSPTDYILKEKQ